MFKKFKDKVQGKQDRQVKEDDSFSILELKD